MAATDADVLVNNVRVTSASNVITDAVDGVTLTLLKKTAGTPITLGVAEDPDVTGSKLDALVSAFNGLVDFANSQATAARKGEKDNIGFDPLLRSLHSTLAALLNRAYPVSGSYHSLANVGIEFDRLGKLKLNTSTFSDAMKTNRADVEKLLAGDGTVDGAFDAIKAAISDYTKSGGLVPDAKSRMEAQAGALGDRIDAMERRLAVRQASLQAEYSAADSMISQLNSQAGSLSSLGASYSAF
jgi:flagellar hook-associated protein 2